MNSPRKVSLVALVACVELNQKEKRVDQVLCLAQPFGAAETAHDSIMMETYYGIDDSGDLQDLWDNDFGVVSTSSAVGQFPINFRS